MYFPLLFQVISRTCFRFTPAAPTIEHSVLHGFPDWPVISIYTLRCLLRVPFTLAVPYSLFIFLVYAPTLPLPFTTGFVIAFIFQAVETLLTISFAVSNAANLYTGPRTVDPCSGREVTSPLATILALESPTTSQPQANQLNQSNEDDLGQVDQITQNYELESGHSLSVKGNLKNNLGFCRMRKQIQNSLL